MSRQKLSRRDLIKMLAKAAAAATGAAAISTVPNKWVTPIVEIGALPAHAQASQRGSIAVAISTVGDQPTTRKANAPKTSFIDWTVTIQNVSTTIGPTNVYEPDDLTGTSCNGVWNKLFTNVPVGTCSVTLKKGADWPCSQADQTQINIVVTAGGTVPVAFTVGRCCP